MNKSWKQWWIDYNNLKRCDCFSDNLMTLNDSIEISIEAARRKYAELDKQQKEK